VQWCGVITTATDGSCPGIFSSMNVAYKLPIIYKLYFIGRQMLDVQQHPETPWDYKSSSANVINA